MKLTGIGFAALVAMGCSRTSSSPRVSPSSDAGTSVIAVVDASAPAPFDAGLTLEGHCRDFIARGDSAEGFMCRGDKVHPACGAKDLKVLGALGTIALADEKGPDGTRMFLALVDANGHFAIVDQVPTEECDLGDPADVSLALVSARESAEGGAPAATIVYDSIRDDPPFQGGARIHSSERRSVRCRAGAGIPVCDKPIAIDKRP